MGSGWMLQACPLVIKPLTCLCFLRCVKHCVVQHEAAGSTSFCSGQHLHLGQHCHIWLFHISLQFLGNCCMQIVCVFPMIIIPKLFHWPHGNYTRGILLSRRQLRMFRGTEVLWCTLFLKCNWWLFPTGVGAELPTRVPRCLQVTTWHVMDTL